MSETGGTGGPKKGRKHPSWGDNVVLADFGARRRREATRDLTTGAGRSKAPSGETESWSAALLMDAVASQADSGRLARGREYYRADKVLGVEMRDNAISGLVAGSQLEPFDVSVRLRPMGSRQKAFVEQELLMDASNVRTIAQGGAPGDDVASILLRSDHVGALNCTCPDKSAVCKHVVCVMYAVAARLTREPMLVLQLRGIDLKPLLQQLGQADQAAGVVRMPGLKGEGDVEKKNDDEPKETSSDLQDIVDAEAFWGEDSQPVTWEPFSEEWGMEQGDEQALMGALRTVSWTGVDQLYIRHELERCYETLTELEPMFDNAPWTRK